MTLEVTAEEQIAKSIVSYNRDDARARYLGLRSSGFSIREALRLIGKAGSTLSAWRKDLEFKGLEERIPEFRKELALEYAHLEFLRNYRLILEKDYRVVKESLEKDVELSKQDHDYLIKLRTHYTPQQLQIMEALVSLEGPVGGFDFTDAIIQFARTHERIQEKVTIKTRKRSESELSTVKGEVDA